MKANYGLLPLLALTVLCGGASSSENQLPEPEARLSGTTIITNNLDTSLDFYTTVLGFTETRIRHLTGSANLAVYGITDSEATLRYTALLPAEWSKDNIYLSSLNLVEVSDLKPSTLTDDVNRLPQQSEIVLAYRVENIGEIMRRAKLKNTPIVAPMSPSSTGKSVTVTMLDPNGIRVYLYSYVPDAE